MAVKVFLLGLDGLTLRIVEPYVRAGLMPNFRKVMDSGTYGILRSTIPSTTGPGWVSMSTGKNPGQHGVFEFRRRNGYKTNLITKNTSPYAEPIWSILSRTRAKVAIVNVPFTYPPDEVNGVMISGLMTPGVNTEFVYPKELKIDLLNLIPDYQCDIDQELFLHSTDKYALVKEVLKITENGRKLMNHLLKRSKWDLFFTVFTAPDRLQHFLWDEVISMSLECVKCYKLLDDTLGDILQEMYSDTVLFIASDHGFMEAKAAFYINNFLKDQGLLEVRGSPRIKEALARRNISTATFRPMIKTARLLGLRKLLPSFLLKHARNLLPSRGIKETEINWENTRAFSLLTHGIVSVNLRGREPHGSVEKQDHQKTCDMIKHKLLELKDPKTNENVIRAVFMGHEIYSPVYGQEIPDLFIVANEGYSINENLGPDILGENRIANRFRTGDHDRSGLWLVYGSMINGKRVDADICDIMPTALYLMGRPIPENVDGRVVKDAIKRDFLARNKIRFERVENPKGFKASRLSEEEKKKLEAQLKSLGYVG